MKQGRRDPIEAERAIALELQSFPRCAAAMWRGREKEATIAVLRAPDLIAVSGRRRSATDDADGRRENARFMAAMGATSALRPFLTEVH